MSDCTRLQFWQYCDGPLMKIAVVSNRDIRCGLGEHGRGVAKALRKKFEVDELLACPESGYDAVIINYLAGHVVFSIPEVRNLRSQGAKVIIILNDAPTRHKVVEGDSLKEVDMVVTHEPMEVIGEGIQTRYIDVGMSQIWDLPEYDIAKGPSVGTAGFPFPSKRMEITVQAAIRIGGEAVMITPVHRFHDPKHLFDIWRNMAGEKLNLITDWLEQEEVVRRLSQCAMNMYYTEEDHSTGQSGSARMILAAGRPTIVRRCKKISPLSAFEDEMYLVTSEHEALDTAFRIWQDLLAGRPVKRPNKVRHHSSWEHVGQQYIDLVEELTGAKV
jgi:hypothetical protein